VVPSFSGEVWGVHGENGHIVDNWPFYLEGRSFHSGALVVSLIDGWGLLWFVVRPSLAVVSLFWFVASSICRNQSVFCREG